MEQKPQRPPLTFRQKLPIYLFLGFFVVLFGLNTVLLAPVQPPVDIGALGSSAIEPGAPGRYYTLAADKYTIGAMGGEIYQRRSSLPIFPAQRYTYYSILVYPDQGEPFSMTVRVTREKEDSLATGQPVDLYGMVSKGQEGVQRNPTLNLEYGSLNDNGETVAGRWLGSGIACLAAVGALALILVLRRR